MIYKHIFTDKKYEYIETVEGDVKLKSLETGNILKIKELTFKKYYEKTN
jgi:hypothetical protein